jgi:hypothetical protein
MEIVANLKMEGGFASKFHKDVIREIAKKVKRKVPVIQTTIAEKIREAVREALISTPEYQSIVQGKLKAELGIPNSDSRIITVIDTWIENIVVKVKAARTPFLVIDIGIIQGDYSDVLSLPQAQYTYKSKRGEGEIPWLKWLLLEGDKRIINKYEFSSNTRGSRTGMGIMISKSRGFWQVPPEFSGTAVDNFATRALENIEATIDKIVEQVIKGSFK